MLNLSMKDLSFFLLKNAFGAKMKKGFKSSCNGDSSTSTLSQNRQDNPINTQVPIYNSSFNDQSSPTLEEMIFQLDFDYGGISKEKPRRMSCVYNSDILRSARNALNQYPRFSLDGKDAMYRSSFRNLPSVNESEMRSRLLPTKFGGERVVWCKPGVVAKLMGLEALPVPVKSNCGSERLSSMIKRQRLRRRNEMNEIESKRLVIGSCSRNDFCVMKQGDDESSCPIQGFL